MRLASALRRLGGDYDTWASLLEQDPAVASKTAAYTATALDDLILCDATSGAFTVTLPKAADNNGKELTVKKTDASANAVTLDGNGSETIDGAATVALSSRYASRTIRSDGTNWHIIASV